MSWAIGDAFINAASELNLRANSLTKNGCSITLSRFDEFSDCGIWRKKAIETLLTDKPKVVVIANSAGYPEQDLKGMGELVALLRESSIKVIFVLPPPGGDLYSGLRALAYRPGPVSRESDLPVKIDLSKYGLTDSETDSGLVIYNPSDDLCGDMCTIAKEGSEYYNYGEHLSLFANKVLENSISKKVEKILLD
jgi:hypothetical protein